MDFIEYVKAFPFITDIPIIIIVFFMVMTGRLVPRRHVLELMKAKDDVIAEQRGTINNREFTTAELLEQQKQLLSSNKITQALLEAVMSDDGTGEEVTSP